MFLAAWVLASVQTGLSDYSGSTADLLRQIQSLGGPELVVDAELAGEPVLLSSPRPVGGEEARQLLAEVFEGEWVEERRGRLFLRIKAEARVRQANEDRTARRDGLERWLAKLAPKPSAEAVVANVMSELETYAARLDRGDLVRNGVMTYVAPTPAQELLTALLKEVGAEELARFEMAQSVAWSSSPVGEQRRLPSGPLALYPQAFERLSGLLEKPEQTAPGEQWSGLYHNLGRDLRGCTYVLSMAPALWGRWTYRLRIYDATGALIDRVYTTFALDENPAAPPAPQWIASLPDSAPLRPRNAQLFAQYQRGLAAARSRDAAMPPSDTQTPLTEPDYEPLSLGLVEMVEAAAKALNRPVIVNVGDGVARHIRTAANDQGVNPRALMQTLWQADEIRAAETGEALVLRPRGPVEARRTRIPRDVLREYAASIIRHQGVSARAEARFAYRGGPPSMISGLSGLWSFALRALALEDNSVRMFYWEGALIGSLSDEQWSALLAGGALRGDQMSKEQLSLLKGVLDNSYTNGSRLAHEATALRDFSPFRLTLRQYSDPTILCTEPGPGGLGNFPTRPMQATALAEWMRTSEKTPAMLTGKYTLRSADSIEFSIRHNGEDWITYQTGPFAPQQKQTHPNLPLPDWPADVRRYFEW